MHCRSFFSSGRAGNTAKMFALPPGTCAEHTEQLRASSYAVLHAEPLSRAKERCVHSSSGQFLSRRWVISAFTCSSTWNCSQMVLNDKIFEFPLSSLTNPGITLLNERITRFPLASAWISGFSLLSTGTTASAPLSPRIPSTSLTISRRCKVAIAMFYDFRVRITESHDPKVIIIVPHDLEIIAIEFRYSRVTAIEFYDVVVTVIEFYDTGIIIIEFHEFKTISLSRILRSWNRRATRRRETEDFFFFLR